MQHVLENETNAHTHVCNMKSSRPKYDQRKSTEWWLEQGVVDPEGFEGRFISKQIGTLFLLVCCTCKVTFHMVRPGHISCSRRKIDFILNSHELVRITKLEHVESKELILGN